MEYENFIDDLKRKKGLHDLSLETFIKKGGVADNFMKERYNEININQLRNLLSEIIHTKPEKFTDRKKGRLEMNLAYDYGRNVIPHEFYELMTKLLSKVDTGEKKNYEDFVEMVRALIAYHKYHTQKKS